MQHDLKIFERAVNGAVKVPLTQNQFDALVSLSYNIGVGAFKKSTLLKKLNSGDYKGAANQFDVWVNAGGKRLAGLVRRRAIEKKLFLGS
jgi:lysozyme